ncbi:uncharacterized protein [Euphorbia lathyris]|uniref:uncharacterized protein n=1 Tax=Euphorbia lathyris TaxID=212925 RepID=UPI003313CE3F
MAAPQSKIISSSSPSLSKPTTPRYSEISNPMRRSFTGNPFAKKQPSIVPNPRSGFNPNTPANSPSDYRLRNSIDSENKENSKDVNVKSPPPSSLKGTKHFMSPTISAASKINAAPRKKMLTERSESVRTSVNRNEALNEDSDFKPEKGLNKKKEVSFNPTVTYLEDKEEEIMTSYEDLDSVADGCDLFSETAPAVDDFVNLDPSFRISPMASNSPLPSPSLAPLAEDLDSVGDGWGSFSETAAAVDDSVNLDPSFRVSPMTFSSSLSSPALAPLDADPLMLPYDPKTNYLAPRPQFRRYKPNPRLELYLKQRYGGQVEESFVSESSSDDEFSEQESDERYLDSQKDSEIAASGDVVPEEEDISEPNSIATFEGAIEGRKVSKRHFLTRPKFTALLFVLALAGLWASVSNSPIMDPSVLNNLNFPNLYVPPEVSQFTRENLEGLAQKFRQWLYESLSYLDNLVSSFTEWHKHDRLQFANMTILLEECSIDNYLMGEHSTFVTEFMHKEKREVDATPVEAHEKDAGGPEIEDEERVEFDELIEEDVEGGYNTAADESSEEVSDDKGQGSESQEAIVVPYSVVEASGIAIVPESDEGSMPTTTTDEANAHSILAAEVTQARVEIAELFGLPSNADVAEEWVAILNAEPDVAHPLAEFVFSPVETESTVPDFETESSDSDAPTMKTQRTGSVDMTVDRIKNLFLGQAVLGTISLTVSSLLAVIAFIFMKNRTSMAPPNAAFAVDQVPRAKKADHSPLSMSTRNTFQQTDVHKLEESCCPSEMSSSATAHLIARKNRGVRVKLRAKGEGLEAIEGENPWFHQIVQ